MEIHIQLNQHLFRTDHYIGILNACIINVRSRIVIEGSEGFVAKIFLKYTTDHF